MNAVLRALGKECEVVQKEIASLRHLIFDDHPEMDLIKLNEEVQKLRDRFPPAIRASEIEFVRSIEFFRRRESEIRKRLRKKAKFNTNDAMDRLCSLEEDLRELNTEIWYKNRR